MKVFKQILFWFSSFTWGIIMTIPGCIGALISLILRKEQIKIGYSYGFIYERLSGSLTLGPFSFLGRREKYNEDNLCYAKGKQIQNAIYGVFYPFLIAIPSLIRYGLFWYSLAWNRGVLAILITSITAIVSGALLTLGIIFNIAALGIIGGSFLCYDLMLAMWLFIPKIGELARQNDSKYAFDDIWFEA